MRLVITIIRPARILTKLSPYMKDILANVSPGKKGHNEFFRAKSENGVAPGDPFNRTGIHH